MASELISKSWRLVWEEKQCMLILFYGAIIAFVIGGFAILVLGIGSLDDLEITPVGFFGVLAAAAFSSFDVSQVALNLLQGMVIFFFQFATLGAIFRFLAGEYVIAGDRIKETWSQLGRVVTFVVLLAVFTVAMGAVSVALWNFFPWLLAALAIFALWFAYIVAAFFLPPIAVAEDIGPIPAISRSYRLGRSVLRTLIGGILLLIVWLIFYGLVLMLGMGLLFVVLAALHPLLTLPWLVASLLTIVVYGLSSQVWVLSFQAQLYQHAVAQLDGDSPSTPEDDFDEEAFHKPKA